MDQASRNAPSSSSITPRTTSTTSTTTTSTTTSTTTTTSHDETTSEKCVCEVVIPGLDRIVSTLTAGLFFYIVRSCVSVVKDLVTVVFTIKQVNLEESFSIDDRRVSTRNPDSVASRHESDITEVLHYRAPGRPTPMLLPEQHEASPELRDAHFRSCEDIPVVPKEENIDNDHPAEQPQDAAEVAPDNADPEYGETPVNPDHIIRRRPRSQIILARWVLHQAHLVHSHRLRSQRSKF